MPETQETAATPCPSWTWGVLGFPKPTRVPCGKQEGHDGGHGYALEWTAREPAEEWVRDRWLPRPLTRNLVERSCPDCAALASKNSGAWPCHRCGCQYHNLFCGTQDPMPQWLLDYYRDGTMPLPDPPDGGKSD